MYLCTFEVTTALGVHRRLGAKIPAGIVDLNAACAWHLLSKGEAAPYRLAGALVPPSMLEFLQGGETSMAFARQTLDHVREAASAGARPAGAQKETIVFDPASVSLAAPLPRPASMRDFYSFEGHAKKGFEKRGETLPQEWYSMPVYYKGNHQSIIGPDTDVEWPAFTEKFDYELELAIIIGKQGKDIGRKDALSHIAGYTVMNDFSARDIQKAEMKVRLGPAKGKDFATAIGPWLVTPDEIPDPKNLKMTARVNGEIWSDGNSGTMHHPFESIIEFGSKGEWLHPGDLLGSGTVTGGCGLELDRWVKPGDVVELEIERLGILRNRIVRPGAVSSAPGKPKK